MSDRNRFCSHYITHGMQQQTGGSEGSAQEGTRLTGQDQDDCSKHGMHEPRGHTAYGRGLAHAVPPQSPCGLNMSRGGTVVPWDSRGLAGRPGWSAARWDVVCGRPGRTLPARRQARTGNSRGRAQDGRRDAARADDQDAVPVTQRGSIRASRKDGKGAPEEGMTRTRPDSSRVLWRKLQTSRHPTGHGAEVTRHDGPQPRKGIATDAAYGRSRFGGVRTAPLPRNTFTT